MKIKTSELTGAALDWAVTVALGWKLERPQDGQFIDNYGNRWLAGYRQYAPKISFSPSTNWAQGGPLIEQYKVDVMYFDRPTVEYWSTCYTDVGVFTKNGPTPLIAICRAVVACKLGEEVEVPDELVGGVV